MRCFSYFLKIFSQNWNISFFGFFFISSSDPISIYWKLLGSTFGHFKFWKSGSLLGVGSLKYTTMSVTRNWLYSWYTHRYFAKLVKKVIILFCTVWSITGYFVRSVVFNPPYDLVIIKLSSSPCLTSGEKPETEIRKT